nr:Stress up-regulated Nod 19 protein [Ipomoea batatas]GME18977.1 Stress up-regulated Nod 19 protein [Ipomoea batatas]
MSHSSEWWLLSVAILILTTVSQTTQTGLKTQDGVKTEVFLSPKFELEPGSVSNKFYYDIDFPRGHIAIKEFVAEVVDEAGNSIPLHETYLHHWLVIRYFIRQGVKAPKYHANMGFQEQDYIIVRNSGVCGSPLPQYFGLGSETRKTDTHVPDPYGIETGNPADIPQGYEEKWMLNVHAIDTRGAEDRLGCTECRCSLYNVTEDESAKAIEDDYIGGLRCCYDGTRCRVKEGVQSIKRSLYLKYTVKYVDWEPSIVPVKIYIFDVTDTWKKLNDSTGYNSMHHCKIEYSVEPCSTAAAKSGCVHTKSLSVSFPSGGDVIYGVAHQHTGGTGSTLYGEDGRAICSSLPIYGEGMEPGNETGYIVGMTTCYPQPGTVKIGNGESLTILSNYSSHQSHTGVMGLFYILVADPVPESHSFLHSQIKGGEMMILPNAILILAFVGIAVLGVAVIMSQRRGERGNDYESIVM